jgi:hypothetical protein
MHPLSPALIIAAASGLAGADPGEDEPRAVDARATAAFVGHVGYWAHYDEEIEVSTWPFPVDADCAVLARLAAKLGVLSAEAPQPGAIYLQWSPNTRQFRRAGIVVAHKRSYRSSRAGRCYDCLVLEGSAIVTPADETDGRRRQQEQFDTAVQWARRTRILCTPSEGDQFISWVDLDDRGDTTRPSPVNDRLTQQERAA